MVTRKDEYGTSWSLELLDSKSHGETTVERLVDPKTQRPVVYVSVGDKSQMLMPSIKGEGGIEGGAKKADEMFATISERAGAK